jgi:site-specific recombinase XerD
VVRAWQKAGIAAATLRGRIAIMRGLYEQMRMAGLRHDNPVDSGWVRKEKFRGKVRCPDRHEVAELDRIMQGIDGFIGARDRAVMGFMRFGGLRIFEVAGLRHEDIEMQDGEVIATVRGKGKFTSRIALLPQLETLLDEYYEYIPKRHRCGPLFIPEYKPGQAMSVRAIRKRCDQYFRLANWRKGLSPHSWRHYLAVTLIEGGVSISEVSRILRHQFLATTFSYYQDVASMRNAAAIKDIPKLLNLRY